MVQVAWADGADGADGQAWMLVLGGRVTPPGIAAPRLSLSLSYHHTFLLFY